MPATTHCAPRTVHLTRLLSIWRSAGWPCRDGIELDLLAADWVRAQQDAAGRETLHVTERGMALLAQARQRRSRAASLHDRMATRVCEELWRQGRIVWRELSLRARMDEAGSTPPASAREISLPGLDPPSGAAHAPSSAAWRMTRPDVFSIRNTSIAAYLHPVVHEVKASRADLLAELRNPAKGDAYRWLSCETYLVLPVGVATPTEIPECYGLWTLAGAPEDGVLECVRPARHQHCTLPFGVWMALARSAPASPPDEPVQLPLADATLDERA